MGVYGAFATAPTAAMALTDGSRVGGYLGRDASNKICWALPTDATWSNYRAVYAMDAAGTVGTMTTLVCQPASGDPAPSSGTTYASGCPSITSGAQAQLSLLAN
jgi:hypothetical protein